MSSSNIPAKTSAGEVTNGKFEDDDSTRPDFIYGGPFIKVEKPNPFLDTSTPLNLLLQGTFKKSFAYYSLKERMPVILTKVIDYLSRDGSKIKSAHGATDEDVRGYIQYITKLKNDLVTNKCYDPLTVDTADAKKWNKWIEEQENKHYYNNTWLFTECYIYRRLREGCELSKKLRNFDPFDEQKNKTVAVSLEPMCIVAEKLVTMLPESDKDKRKADFMTLLKICLWANKCDLSLSAGEQVALKSKENATEGQKGKESHGEVIDPFQMIIDLKDKILVDDSAKVADLVVNKADAIAKAIDGASQSEPAKTPTKAPTKTPAAETSPTAPAEGTGEETPKIPCPAKMTIPQSVYFDIICDNAGYELFSDLCLAHFLVAQKIVKKVRFHLKNMPWFVSDVTPRDFRFVIDSCLKAKYKREVPPEPKPESAEGETPAEAPRVITSEHLNVVADQWSQFVEDGVFIVMNDDYWTWPHVYRDMKKYDPNMYRKLQNACGLLFKGDLNYRKLLGEKNWNPVIGFEASLQGFIPAPIIAVRTVKCDLISGLPKGKYEQLMKIDQEWMRKGDYGVIQLCPKAEQLKTSDRPCPDYGGECRGVVCPTPNNL